MFIFIHNARSYLECNYVHVKQNLGISFCSIFLYDRRGLPDLHRLHFSKPKALNLMKFDSVAITVYLLTSITRIELHTFPCTIRSLE